VGEDGQEPLEAAELLRDERARTERQVRRLTEQLDDIVSSSALTVGDDEHDPEGPTIAFERAQLQGRLAEARRELDSLDEAQQRLDTGTYGRCEHCGEPIPPGRLQVLPTTSLCARCTR
jgi:RNA polymerase-binding transcription factor DksA